MKKILAKLATRGIGTKVAVTLAMAAVTVSMAACGFRQADPAPVIQPEQQIEESKESPIIDDSKIPEEESKKEEPKKEEPKKEESESNKPQPTNPPVAEEKEEPKKPAATKEPSKGSLSDILDNLFGKKDPEENAAGSGNTSTQEPEEEDEPESAPTPIPQYTVDFELGSGNTMEDAVVAQNTAISSLDTPYWADHIFLGWYYDEALTQAVESKDTVTKDMTLYASWLEQTPLETLERVNFASAENVGKDFTIKVLTTDENMDAEDVKAALSAQNLTNPAVMDFIKVDPADDGFVISGIQKNAVMGDTTGFEEGVTYTIKLASDALTFAGYPESAREFNFTTYKEEVLNFTLNRDIIYIPAADLENIINNGQTVSTLSIALYNVSNDSGISVAELTEGSFTYTKDTLEVGQIVSVYDGLIPTERTLETSEEQLGDIGYVEITAVNGNTYSFENAQIEEVIFTPDMLPMPEGVDLDSDDATLTVEDKYFDYSADLYSQMDLDSQTKVEVGDFLVFYTGDLTISEGEGAAQRTGFAEITSVTKNNDETTTVTYKEVTWEEVDSSMDVYTQDSMTAEEMLEGINQEEIEAQIEQQAYDSGFAEEAAQYLASLAFATENFTKLSDNMNLEDYKVTLTDGTPVSPEQLNLMGSGISAQNTDTQVKASVSRKPTHLGNVPGTNADREGLVITLEVTSVISVESADEEGELEITITGKFVEEIGFDFGASSDTEWSYLGGIIPYISEWTLAANVDLINYTGLEITATMITKEAEDDSIIGNAANIAEEIKELLKQNTNPVTGEEHHNKLIEKYSEVVHADSDWIRVVEINICELDKHLPPPVPVIHLQFTADFVIDMDASVAVGFEFEYLEGNRYIFNVRVKDKIVESSTVKLQEKTYELCFYAMGRIAVKAGIELNFKVGVISTAIANVGFEAGAGPYTKLWGYFYYELKYTESLGRNQSYSGALLTQVGVYFNLGLKAEAIGGIFSTEYTVLDKEWLLWEAGRRDNVLDFNMAQEEMPEMVMRQYVRRLQLPDTIFDMLYLDLITGDGRNAIYNDWDDPERENDFRNGANYQITMTNDKFSYDPKTNEILVTVEEGDIRVQGEMIITWKMKPMSFSSKPIQRRITLYWDNLRDGYMIVPYTNGGSYVPIIIGAYEAKVTKPQDPERLGYIFDGWYSDETFSTAYTFPEKMPNTDTNIYAKWEPATNIPYRVEHYKENLQSGEYELVETEDFIGTTDTYVTPEVKDYEGYIAPLTQEIKVQADGSAVLRYYYKLQNHTVTFFSDGIGRGDSVNTLRYGAKITPPKMAANGYTFVGWTIDGTTPVEPASYMGSENLEYTAMWKLNEEPDIEYRVEYYVQQTDGSYKLQHLFTEKAYVGTVLKEADLRAILIDGVSADEKYTDGAGITVSNMTVKGVVCDQTQVTGDGKLVVKINYVRTVSDLTFDPAFDGADAIVKEMYYQQPVDAPLNPTRIGYTFVGWDDLRTPEVKAVSPLTVMVAEDVTYQALWIPNNYTVYFHKGNDLAEGDMAAQAFTYDAAPKALTQNTFTYTYYDFAGWSAVAGGSIAYADKEAVMNLSAQAGGSVDLYAVWTPTIYDVAYHNVETATHTNPAQYHTENETITLLPASRAGYTFDGWYKTADFSGEAVATIAKGSGGDLDLYAKWTAHTDIPYKVEHYKEQLDGTFILEETELLNGSSDATVYPGVKDYIGFAAPEAKALLITVDGQAYLRYEYTRKNYTLTFDPDYTVDGENIPVIEITAKYGEPISRPELTRDGYALAGWYKDGVKFEGNTMPAENLTFKGVWEAGKYTYTVKHHKENLNGNEDIIETETFTANMDEEVTPALKDYEGFSPASTVQTIQIGTGVNQVDYYYTRNQYTLSWDLNGGEVNASYTEGSVYYGAAITAPVPEKYGYSYIWDDLATAEVEAVSPITVMGAKDASYKAIWTPNTYTVSFDLNGGSLLSGDAAPRTIAFDSAYGELPVLSKTGYTFEGWFTQAESGSQITAETIHKITNNRTLYAQFTPVTYSITYVDELSGTHANETSYSVLTGGITLQDAEKTGYTFLGWYENDRKMDVIPAGSVGNRTLSARWQENHYTVTFHSNNGLNDTIQQTFNYTDSKALTAKPDGFVKAGFEFAGWATSTNGAKVYDNEQTVGQLTATVNGNVDLYAVWNEVTYQINYVFVNGNEASDSPNRYLDGVTNGTVDGNNPGSYSYSDNYHSLYVPSKAGYEFVGWYQDAALEQELSLDTAGVLTFADYRDQTLYAKFMPITYDIVYKYWLDEFETDPNKIYGEEIIIYNITDILAEGKAGYTFRGWATEKNGEVVYTGGQITSSITTNNEITLYAVWELNRYTISYNLGSHANETDASYPKEYSAETEADITLPAPAGKAGFRFGGWYTDQACTNPIEVINVKTAATDYTLYAKWEHGGEFNISSRTTSRTVTGGYEVTFTVTRTIPEGAVVSTAPQKVYVRTVNGTAYGTTPEVYGTTQQDKYHFKHVNPAEEGSGFVAFTAADGNGSTKTFTVIEADQNNNDYMAASYQSNSTKRYYNVEIYKVDDTTGICQGTIGNNKSVKKEIEAGYYSVTDFYSSSYFGYFQFTHFDDVNVFDENGAIGNSSLQTDPFLVGDTYRGKAPAHIKLYNDLASTGYHVDVSYTIKRKYGTASYIMIVQDADAYSTLAMQTKKPTETEVKTTYGISCDVAKNQNIRLRWQLSTASGSSYSTYTLKGTVSANDTQAPVQQGIAPMALTEYKAGDSITFTVIYNEVVHNASGLSFSLPSALSGKVSNVTYQGGAGTNALVFTGKVTTGFKIDTTGEVTNTTFVSHTSAVFGTVKDYKNN